MGTRTGEFSWTALKEKLETAIRVEQENFPPKSVSLNLSDGHTIALPTANGELIPPGSQVRVGVDGRVRPTKPGERGFGVVRGVNLRTGTCEIQIFSGWSVELQQQMVELTTFGSTHVEKAPVEQTLILHGPDGSETEIR